MDDVFYVIFGFACLIGTIVVLCCIHSDYSNEKQKIAIENGYFKKVTPVQSNNYYERWIKK